MLKIDLFNIIFTIINLLILFVGLKIFLFKPIQKIIDERQKEADRKFDEAAAAQAQADSMKTQYEQSLSDMEREKKETLLTARRNADEQYKKIIMEAEQNADKLKQDAVAEAKAEKEEIIKSVEKDIADMILDATKKVVGKQCGEAMDNSLYNEFLDRVGE